jgi:hypothetical protein
VAESARTLIRNFEIVRSNPAWEKIGRLSKKLLDGGFRSGEVDRSEGLPKRVVGEQGADGREGAGAAGREVVGQPVLDGEA